MTRSEQENQEMHMKSIEHKARVQLHLTKESTQTERKCSSTISISLANSNMHYNQMIVTAQDLGKGLQAFLEK